MKDILAHIVLEFVHHTVNLKHVDTQTVRVIPVLQVGWVIIVHKVDDSHISLLTKCRVG